MIKTDVTKIYSMEELLPIVGRLAEEFTARESSSVTYERARQFMEAVTYCIAHFEAGNNSAVEAGGLSAEKALSGFFLYYDAKFAPTENIITMDYPVFGLDMELEGIDMIKQYIDTIWEEQSYLMRFPRNYIVSELSAFHPNYEKEYFNVKEIVKLQMETEC